MHAGCTRVCAGGNTHGTGRVPPFVSESIKIDIWSDIACPWCYIGKRKFESGAAAFAQKMGEGAPDVVIEYHSYELAPDTPVDFDGSEIDFLSSHKGMPTDQVTEMLDRVTGIASDAGLDYDFDTLKHTNTVKAHQLLHYAKSHGKQIETKERLLKAYFTEGRHVGRIADLGDLAAEVGLDRDDVVRALERRRIPRCGARRPGTRPGVRNPGRSVLRHRRQVRRLRRTGGGSFRRRPRPGLDRTRRSTIMTDKHSRPALTRLGATDAVTCEGDACALPSLAEVTAAVEKAFSRGL